MPLYEGLGYAGEKTAVVIDIGAAYTKCGFAGEHAPRAIIPSEVKRPRGGELVLLHNCTDEKQLYGSLLDFVHILYFRHLLVNPKERRVVVVESVLTTSTFRDTLAKVLFDHYEVLSILFAPSHLMALFTLGIPSGLVMDTGYSESLVLPVYEGTPILKAWEAIPLAGKAIHSQLDARLMESATVKISQSEPKPIASVIGTLDEKVVEDIKVRCCFVTKYTRARQIQLAQEEGETDKLPAPPPAVDYPLDGDKIMHIDGNIREKTCELLFEQDSEERSLATLILDSILKCPIDMRRVMAENVVIMGGTAMFGGFLHRLQMEVQELLTRPKYSQQLAIKKVLFHKPPAKENYVAWLGGAIFGALEVLAARSLSREVYQQTKLVPDWSTLIEFEDKDDKSILQSKKLSTALASKAT